MKVLRNKLGFVVLGALALGFVALVFTIDVPARTPDLSQYPSLSDATLEGRTIVDFGENPDGTVTYTYLEKPVPKILAEREVPELRTENSYTVLEKVVGEKGKEEYTLTSTFFAQPAFAQDVDGSWRYLEYATTTQEAFRNRSQTLFERIAESLVRTAYADSVSPFSGAGDGQIASSTDPFGSATFADIVASVSGTPDHTGTTAEAFVNTPSIGALTLRRIFLPFDTSTIPAGAMISDGALNVYVTTKQNTCDLGNDYLSAVRTSQATHTELVSADIDNITSTEGHAIGERKAINSISTSAYLAYTLNSTGIGWIAKASEASNCSATNGISCFGMRIGDDIQVTTPADLFGNCQTYVDISTSEHTGTSQDPYLTVTYTVSSSQAVQSGGVWLGGGGGRLQIVGGRVQIF